VFLPTEKYIVKFNGDKRVLSLDINFFSDGENYEFELPNPSQLNDLQQGEEVSIDVMDSNSKMLFNLYMRLSSEGVLLYDYLPFTIVRNVERVVA
jgi:hypothetical protein